MTNDQLTQIENSIKKLIRQQKDLSMLVKVLCRRIDKLSPEDEVSSRAKKYLKKNHLEGSILR